MTKPSMNQAVEAVRAGRPDDTELRESLRVNGWVPRFPAVKDENGVVLIGHRRLRIAEELGIKPIVETWKLGNGTAADVERVKLALISNVGGAAATPADRRHLAQHIYEQQGWTQAQIAEVLGVSQRQVSTYLKRLEVTSKREPVTDKLGRKNAGRPKAKREGQRGKRPAPKTEAAREVVRQKLEAGETVSPHKLQEEHGISHVTFDMAITAETARRDVIDELAATKLSESAEARWEAVKRARLKQLESSIEQRVTAEVDRRITNVYIAGYKERLAEAQLVVEGRRGVMDAKTYRLIAACLHPDSRASVSEKRLGEAFHAFEAVKVLLCDNKEMPLKAPAMPNTAAEWDEMARQAAAARKGRTRRAVSRAP